MGGVRPFHVGHEQAHFLIGPPPLGVQLTVIPKRHLKLDRRIVAGARQEGTAEKKVDVNTTESEIFETELYGCRMRTIC